MDRAAAIAALKPSPSQGEGRRAEDAAGEGKINLLPLETHEKLGADFRADELYFIRMAGVYLQSIFWDVFRETSSKSSRKRYRMMHTLAKDIQDEKLRAALVTDTARNLEVKDFLSTHFNDFLTRFQPKLRDEFERRMKQDHALMIAFDELVSYHYQLTQKRHFLEHPKKTPCHNDLEFIIALGTLLLRGQHNLYLGRLYSYLSRLECDAEKDQLRATITRIDYIFSQRRRRQSQWNHQCFSEEKSKKNIPDKNRRKANLQRKEKRTKPSLGEYREFEYKRRRHFIGEPLYNAIEKRLRRYEDEQLSFRREIEELYFFSCAVNLHLHRAMPAKKERKGALRNIRNAIAHTNLFWRVTDNHGHTYDVEQVFRAVLDDVKTRRGNVKASELYNDLTGVMKKQVYAWVWQEKQKKQLTKIRRWNKEKQEIYNADDYNRDKRKRLRRVVGEWRVALRQANRKLKT